MTVARATHPQEYANMQAALRVVFDHDPQRLKTELRVLDAIFALGGQPVPKPTLWQRFRAWWRFNVAT